MNKIAAVFAVITGLLGLALTTRQDILYSLPIGGVLIIICGISAYISLKKRYEDNESKHKNMLHTLSLEEIKTSLYSITDALGAIAETQSTYYHQIIEKDSAKHDAIYRTNELLEQLTETLKSEGKALTEHYLTTSETTTELILKAISNFEKCGVKIEKELISQLEITNNVISETNNEIANQTNTLHNISSQIKESLGQILSMFQTDSKTFIEQQQNLYTIILEDIEETLNEFTENQSRNAEDTMDSIKRVMNETNRALKELPLSLESFNTQNAETIQKSAEGFVRFETLVNATLEQLTTISNQDYELLKGMLE